MPLFVTNNRKNMLSHIKYVLIFLAINLFADFNFTIPAIVTGNGSPNLSVNGETAENPQIATDSISKYVYAIWRRFDGSNHIIQAAISSCNCSEINENSFSNRNLRLKR